MRGAAESLQLQEHLGPGGVGDAAHSRSTGEGSAGAGAQERSGAGGAEVAEQPGALQTDGLTDGLTVADRSLWLDEARRASAGLSSII